MGGAQSPKSHKGTEGLQIGAERQCVDEYRQNVVSVRHKLKSVFLVVGSEGGTGVYRFFSIPAEGGNRQIEF